MGSLLFFTKSLVLTFILVTLLQIKVGPETLEEKAMNWVHHSEVTTPLREIAEGGARAVRDLWNTTLGQINTKFMSAVNSENRPGERLNINFDRSKEYLKKQAARAAEKLKEKTSKASEVMREELDREGVFEAEDTSN